VELEEALDALYDATPEDFVAERKRLAKELKAAGHAEDAVQLTNVRKPTVAAWALNRLARDHRREVDLLLDSGHRMRTAQAGVLRGEAREAFEQAQRTERETIARLVREAEHLLGGASAAVLEQIAASLHAAAVSEVGREVLAAGRFTQPLSLEGFNALAGLAPPPSKRAPRPKPSRSAEELKRARAELAEAKKRLREAERTAHEAHKLAAQADVNVGDAAEAVRKAEQRLR
jgi:cellobiose-specific phosphotransferase system component IIA